MQRIDGESWKQDEQRTKGLHICKGGGDAGWCGGGEVKRVSELCSAGHGEVPPTFYSVIAV